MPIIALEKVDFLPPERVTDDTSILTLKTLVFEPLLRWQPGGGVAPGLFADWSVADEGRNWTFRIRQDAVFHDGVPCRAGDVLEFIEGILGAVDMFGMKWSYARYLADARIEAVDADTVRVRNPEPLAAILDIFAEFYLCRRDAEGRPVLGTGPYRVDGLEPGSRALLSRVRGRGPGTLEFRAVPEADQRLGLLEDGRIDAAHNLERKNGRVAIPSGFVRREAANVLSVMAYLDCAAGPFVDPRARKAVNMAVDRARLVNDVFGGLAIPAASVVSPFHLGMDPDGVSPPAFDPDGAKRLFDAAGGPSKLSLRTPDHMPDRAPAIAAFIAESLDAIGVAVDIEVEADRPEYARQVGRKQIGDMALFDSSPQSTFRVLDDKISSRSRGVWWQGFEDAEAQRLIEQANAAVSLAERRQAYGRCLRYLAGNPPWLYLVHPVVVLACRAEAAARLGVDHKGIVTIIS
jgi:peptide/nickel transport system substrate-binding protein